MSQEPTLDAKPEYGPYLNVALLCERVLEEKDGVNSVVRIIDQVNITAAGPGAPPQIVPGVVKFTILLIIKTGEMPGPCEIEIIVKKPDLTEVAKMARTVNLESPAYRGMTLKIETELQVDQVGLWWFEIFIRGMRRTRIPLNVVYLAQRG